MFTINNKNNIINNRINININNIYISSIDINFINNNIHNIVIKFNIIVNKNINFINNNNRNIINNYNIIIGINYNNTNKISIISTNKISTICSNNKIITSSKINNHGPTAHLALRASGPVQRPTAPAVQLLLRSSRAQGALWAGNLLLFVVILNENGSNCCIFVEKRRYC